MKKTEETNFSSTAVLTISGAIQNNSPKNFEETKPDYYNPLENREVPYPNSDGQSLANLLKSSLGSGILAMPLAFKNAGLVIGTLGTIIIGYICTHCAQILVQTSREICTLIRVPSLGYAETCEEAFANGPKCLQKFSKSVRYITDFAMALTYLGACCVYVVLITNSVKQLVETYKPEFVISVPVYCAMLLLPLILFVQIKNLKQLAPFSTCANFMFVTVVGITLYYTVRDLPSINERNYFTSVTTLPSFLSTVIFAMEGIGIVMYIENSMANPAHFLGCPGVLNISMIIIILLYGVLGFLGYIKYGPEVLGSITLNLDNNSIAGQIAKVLIILAIICTYALQFYISIQIIWKYVKGKIAKKWRNLANIILRVLFVIVTVCCGAAIPQIDAIIGLVGAIFYSTLGLFVPALVQIVFRWNRNLGKLNWILWKNICIIIFSFVALVCGVTVTIYDMLK